MLDPFPLLLDAVEEVLVRNEVEVVGKSTAPQRALDLVSERRPELLVTEIRFPGNGVDGIELLREARRRRHELRPIVFTAHDSSQAVGAAFDAGAAAYVLKDAHPDDLASAIRQAFHHSIYLPSAPPVGDMEGDVVGESEVLTRRESEIIRLVAEGHSNAELAKMLWVTEQTIKFHLSNIYRKLNVANRTEASRWAQLHGLLPGSQPSRPPAFGLRSEQPVRLLRTAS